MFISFFITTLLLAVAQAQKSATPPNTAVRPPYITSPGVCIREVDCPATQYCTFDLVRLEESYICKDRIKLGQQCSVRFGEQRLGSPCLNGLYCSFMSGGSGPTCAKQIPLGGTCDRVNRRSCLGRLTVCRQSDSRCVLQGTGTVGQQCSENIDCQQARGLYCQAGTCARRKPTGAVCGMEGSFDECRGLCATSGETSGGVGVCAPAQPEGGLCRNDRHCKQPLQPGAEQLVCNMPSGNVGRCIRGSRLIKSLGAACKPSFDRCDTMRGLVCHWTVSSKRYVCQQRISARDVNVQRRAYCTPGSPLSTCTTGSVPTSCAKDTQTNIRRAAYKGFFGCTREQIIPPGLPCTTATYSVCAAGSLCELVPDVRKVDIDFAPVFPTRFCVRTVGLGASCANKFSARCGANLACVAGRCVASTSPTPTAVVNTHADLRVDCSELPCVPGAVCPTPDPSGAFTFRACAIRTRVMQEHEVCFDSALVRRSCAPGLICRPNNRGLGLLLCRKPAPIGAICRFDTDCESNLQCIFVIEAVSLSATRFCYDPSLTPPIGQTCDPKATLKTNRCIIAPTLFNPSIYMELRCLPKGLGFVCQRAARLFQLCDPQLNIACIDGAVCSSYGVCVPPS